MLTQPAELSDDLLAAALGEHWGVAVATMHYLALGFGSHHWHVADAGGASWFLTVDDLDAKRHATTEAKCAAFERLRAALTTAVDLQTAGCDFVIAPIRTFTGAPLIHQGRFALALFPNVTGETYDFGEFATLEHRHGVARLVAALHSVPRSTAPAVLADDFAIPRRDELESSLVNGRAFPESGPYARRVASLLAENASTIRRALAGYDSCCAEVKTSDWPQRAVLTHGEPHAGNTIRTERGWVLVDWDTVFLALPERDLWSLDPGDASVLRIYGEANRCDSPRARARPVSISLGPRRYRGVCKLVSRSPHRNPGRRQVVGRAARPRRRSPETHDSDVNWRSLGAPIRV